MTDSHGAPLERKAVMQLCAINMDAPLERKPESIKYSGNAPLGHFRDFRHLISQNCTLKKCRSIVLRTCFKSK